MIKIIKMKMILTITTNKRKTFNLIRVYTHMTLTNELFGLIPKVP